LSIPLPKGDCENYVFEDYQWKSGTGIWISILKKYSKFKIALYNKTEVGQNIRVTEKKLIWYVTRSAPQKPKPLEEMRNYSFMSIPINFHLPLHSPFQPLFINC
jgi:hypothetical protein